MFETCSMFTIKNQSDVIMFFGFFIVNLEGVSKWFWYFHY